MLSVPSFEHERPSHHLTSRQKIPSTYRESGHGIGGNGGKQTSPGTDRTPLRSLAMRPTTTSVKPLNKMHTLPTNHENISVTHLITNPSRMDSVDSSRPYGKNHAVQKGQGTRMSIDNVSTTYS